MPPINELKQRLCNVANTHHVSPQKFLRFVLYSYNADIKLSGILYLHRITDNRMSGSPHRNLRMFGQLCGDQASRNVILITTMWDNIEVEVGLRREKELREKFWKVRVSACLQSLSDKLTLFLSLYDRR